MKSFREIIEKVGIAPLAELLGVEESHVRVMKARDSIPPEYWGQIIEAHPELTYAALRKMRTGRFQKDAPAEQVPA